MTIQTMEQYTIPVSAPEYSPPINYNSDLFGAQPSLNTDYNCDVQGGQYPYAEQDHLALRHLAFRNFIRPRTLDGKTVYKPVNEDQFSCECNLTKTPLTSKYNNESLKFEVKSGVIKRGCDCIKRNGLQDRCPRVRHENRWECLIALPHGCTSGPALPGPHYANHLHRPTRPPYSNPCVSAFTLHGSGTVRSSCGPYCQDKPRSIYQPSCVRSQKLPKKGSTVSQNNSSRMGQKSNTTMSNNTNEPKKFVFVKGANS